MQQKGKKTTHKISKFLMCKSNTLQCEYVERKRTAVCNSSDSFGTDS